MAKILIVDDEPWWVSRLQEELESKERGHTCETARSIEEAEKKLAGESFDGVILDVIVPMKSIEDYARSGETAQDDAAQAVVGGVRLYETIQRGQSAVPVVIFSVKERDAIEAACSEVKLACPVLQKGARTERDVADALERLLPSGGVR